MIYKGFRGRKSRRNVHFIGGDIINIVLKVILRSFLQACKNTIIGISILAIIMGILIFFYSNFNQIVVFVGFVFIVNFIIYCLLNFDEIKRKNNEKSK